MDDVRRFLGFSFQPYLAPTEMDYGSKSGQEIHAQQAVTFLFKLIR